MLKKRVIFTLLYEKNYFVLSRNFNLQRFGNYKWLINNYDFKKVAFSIDELIILNINRGKKDFNKFCQNLKKLNEISFIPICAGGGVKSLDTAIKILNSGADKIVLNSILYNDPDLVKKISQIYGSQSIVASVDVKFINNKYKIFIENGKKLINISLSNWLENISKLNIGEVYINSIDKDGTGNGYDFKILREIPSKFSIPIIFAGGAGNYSHLLKGLKNSKIDAVSSANLVNFVGDGLINARSKLLKNNIKLAIRNETTKF